ncbi:MAG: M23 family metallopeptidase [Anaerolineales bacterium]|nr:M23 family metallopeptidase [Anaerolineales bacterium]
MKRFVCLFCLLLAACAAPPPEPTATASPPPPVTPSPLPSATATEEPSPTPIPISAVCSPLGGHSFQALLGYISQGFSPPPSSSNWDGGHHGLDFAYYQRNDPGGFGGHIEGAPLQSVLDGYVAGLGYASIYGHYLIVETPWAQLPPGLAALYSVAEGQSAYVMYAHLQEEAPFVLSEPLDCGQMVGQVGATGDAFFVVEPHLHFELRVGASGLRLAAMTYYGAQDSPAEQEEYRRWRNSLEFLLHDPLPLFNFGAAENLD